MKKTILIAAVIVSALNLAACDTIPRKLGMNPVTEPVNRCTPKPGDDPVNSQCYYGGAGNR